MCRRKNAGGVGGNSAPPGQIQKNEILKSGNFRGGFREWGIPLLVIGIFYGVLFAAGITCPIKFVTGISCPGCGMTRAWITLLRGDGPGKAAAYHPLFWIIIPAGMIFLFRKRLHSRLKRILAVICIAAVLAVYLYRMLFSDHSIVVFAPEEGLIGRTIVWLEEQIRQILMRGRAC